MTVVLGIAGGSGGGKTTLAQAVYKQLGESANVTYLKHDNYYKHKPHLTFDKRSQSNYDHPDSLDTALLVKHIRDLKAGNAAEIPNYDFSTHLRKPDYTKEEPKSIILVEGILIFSDASLLKELDLKIYVDCDSDIRLMRRIARDTSERDRTSEEVMAQYSATVRPMHHEFVEPTKLLADIIIDCSGVRDSSVALNMITTYVKCEADARTVAFGADSK
mmetsp:Transcript_658/g.717  ORF Transcript_658/g.717 Transcript_658/m.717 type:complete len:218 (+) Transcript_658:80-733(+)|eukprot:CAMPEP_0198259714 /NCGR_PEP_ID=MMETSP1447-20131203/8835_1 /TAXON_ID=420782 /ORGANISM="Chaetoceros dichaeta, Strain CCMP1751" /LENGTH=217 /DNA_ID=CAMNT_0043947165 /DNA_START=59 /DNA_END=712 /DNA_ORIENTATION=-